MWFWLFLQKKRNISNDYYYYYYYYIIIIITYFLISHSDDYCFSLNASFNVLLHCINFSWIEFVPHFFQIDYLILLALNVELSILKGIIKDHHRSYLHNWSSCEIKSCIHIFLCSSNIWSSGIFIFICILHHLREQFLLGLVAEVMGSNPVQALCFFFRL